jgi:hypothetical protein
MFNKLIKDSTITKALHSKEMGSAAVHVLHYFSFSVNKQNMVVGTPKELAKSFRMSILQFNQGVQMLKKLQVIKKYTKKEYMLNPDIAYSGDDKRYYILKHMWDTQTTRGLRNL